MDSEKPPCTVRMPDGSSKEGVCQASSGGRTGICGVTPAALGLCSRMRLGKACTWAGFTGVCVADANDYIGHVCDVWANKPIMLSNLATTTAAPTAKCPDQCRSPACKAGKGGNGGFALQYNGVCSHTCSKAYGGVRYCGTGHAYTYGDSIDCSGCKEACPPCCKDPSCVKGAAHNGGLPLVSGSCQHVCSKPFGPVRYCGSGSAYMQPKSIDCTACVEGGPGGSGGSGGSGDEIVATCSAKCASPTCVRGAAYNGGSALTKGRCNQHCSREYGGVRYCGWGDAHTTGDSIDCRPCMDDQYVHAPDSSTACPPGYTWVGDIETCMMATTIAGTQYTWSGTVGCQSSLWPRRGCFTWGATLYYSTCEATRPMSSHSHDGVCKKSNR